MGLSQWVGKAYDAITGNNRRRRSRADTRAEDNLLTPLDRDTLVSSARSLRRNEAIAAWCIRKHLDYVSTFNFQCRSKDPELNRRIESLMSWWSRPFNCDVSGRHSLSRLIRMLEGCAITDGDAFFYKVSDGRIQIIESDRVRTPTASDAKLTTEQLAAFTHGIRVTDSGSALEYAICDRAKAEAGNSSEYKLRELVPSQYVYHHGYFDRYDQVRGISPLSSALNTYFDIYEAREYALAKMKLSQLFALKFKYADGVPTDENGEPTTFDFGSGPQVVELANGDDVDFLESATPSTEFANFMLHGIQVALKALDIPYSFFNESFTNYSGSRQALLQYEQSCEEKRNRLIQVLNNLTVWRLGLFIADGELELPEGWTLDDITFEWIPVGIPWIDPMKEVAANAMAIKSSLKSRQMVCKENGLDWFTILEQIKQENDALAALGLNTDIDNVTAIAASLVAADAAQQQQGAKNNAA